MMSRRLKIATWVGSVATVASGAFLGLFAYHTHEHKTRGWAEYVSEHGADKYHYEFSDIDGIRSIKLYSSGENVHSLFAPEKEDGCSLSNVVWKFENKTPILVSGCLGIDRYITHFVVTDMENNEQEFPVPPEQKKL